MVVAAPLKKNNGFYNTLGDSQKKKMQIVKRNGSRGNIGIANTNTNRSKSDMSVNGTNLNVEGPGTSTVNQPLI